MEAGAGGQAADQRRLPLSEVVSDCINRWFQDTLKEAKTGDINMQVLVGQMYYCGYGVSKDANKVQLLKLAFLFLNKRCFSSYQTFCILGIFLLNL